MTIITEYALGVLLAESVATITAIVPISDDRQIDSATIDAPSILDRHFVGGVQRNRPNGVSNCKSVIERSICAPADADLEVMSGCGSAALCGGQSARATRVRGIINVGANRAWNAGDLHATSTELRRASRGSLFL